MRRVAITGMGVVSSLGSDLGRFWQRLLDGESGIRQVRKFDPAAFDSRIAGEVAEFDVDAFVPRKQQRRMDEFCWFALAAAKMAMADSGLDMNGETPERAGAIIGSGCGGLQTLETQHSVYLERGPARCSPFMIPQLIVNMAGGLIAIEFNLKGPNYAAVSACASAAHSIGEAARMIRLDEADIMLGGGAEAAVSVLGLSGFCAMRALSTRNDEPRRASRPFDRDRDGFVMADGAAVVVLEEMQRARRRGARVYAELAGFGMTCDAFHMTAPDEEGKGACAAMRLAMERAAVNAGQVDYINAHGTSTLLNDKVETRAIKTALGREAAARVMVSSSKSMTGHALGAAGGLETVVCAMALSNQAVPPTINLDHPDPECDLDYVPHTAREARVDVCVNNSLGFGGHNACLVLKKA